jgi:hypothetical protein
MVWVTTKWSLPCRRPRTPGQKLSAKTPTFEDVDTSVQQTYHLEGDELLALRGEAFLRVVPLLAGDQ